MVPLTTLWLPILLSGLFVFIAGNILWMALPFWHNRDYGKLVNQQAFIDAAKAEKSGQYIFPWMDWKNATAEQKAEMKTLPSGYLLIRNPPSFSFPKALIGYLLYSIVISFFVAYLTGRTLGVGADYREVFRIAGTAGTLAWAFGTAVSDSLWYGKPWIVTIKTMIDGLLYGLLIGGTFGWLWPK